MKTTLNKIKSHDPYYDGWRKLLTALGKTAADDEALPLRRIFETSGLELTLYALCTVDGFDREKRLYAVWCARQVKHLMTDQKSLEALEVAERHANGEASDEELSAAFDAASDVAWGLPSPTNKATRAAWITDKAIAMTAAEVASRDASDAARDTFWEALKVVDLADPEKEFIRMLDCIDKGERYEI